jgi:hypothetical protein
MFTILAVIFVPVCLFLVFIRLKYASQDKYEFTVRKLNPNQKLTLKPGRVGWGRPCRPTDTVKLDTWSSRDSGSYDSLSEVIDLGDLVLVTMYHMINPPRLKKTTLSNQLQDAIRCPVKQLILHNDTYTDSVTASYPKYFDDIYGDLDRRPVTTSSISERSLFLINGEVYDFKSNLDNIKGVERTSLESRFILDTVTAIFRILRKKES